MTYKSAIRIDILFESDNLGATIYEPNSQGIYATAENVYRWRKWLDIINESSNNESLMLAIEHAETIYGLCRER